MVVSGIASQYIFKQNSTILKSTNGFERRRSSLTIATYGLESDRGTWGTLPEGLRVDGLGCWHAGHGVLAAILHGKNCINRNEKKIISISGDTERTKNNENKKKFI